MRTPLALLLLAVLALLARAWVAPVYVGAVDPDATARRFGIQQPFGDDLKGSSDALHSLLAQSLLREGLAATGGIPLLNPTPVPREDFFYYDHHPPGVSLVTALAFRWLGPTEAVARGVALFFSTVTLLVVAGLAWRAAGGGAAALALVAMAAPPAGLYWASHLDYPVPTLAMTALFLALCAGDGGGAWRHGAATLALLVALSFDFLAVLAPAALALDRLLAGPRRPRALFGWPLLCVPIVAALIAWKHFAIARHGHGDGAGLMGHVAAVWQLPEGVSTLAWLRTVEGHLRGLVTPLGEGVLALGLLRALLPGGCPPLKRLVRTGVLFALAAGLLPRLRAWDHPYFQLYWLLPLGASAALLCATLVPGAAGEAAPRGLPLCRMAAAMVALAFVGAGALERPRSTIDPARPSAHRLGRELAAALPAAADAPLVLIPADARLDGITLCWYAGRMVAKALDDPPDRARTIPFLAPFGLADAPAWWAPGAEWPGREGVAPLR